MDQWIDRTADTGPRKSSLDVKIPHAGSSKSKRLGGHCWRSHFRTLFTTWSQQNEALLHFSVIVRDYLNLIFRIRWIGRKGSIERPARSPDLTPLDPYETNSWRKHLMNRPWNANIYLSKIFLIRSIGRRMFDEWPPRSPDLTSLFFFGHLKNKVYVNLLRNSYNYLWRNSTWDRNLIEYSHWNYPEVK